MEKWTGVEKEVLYLYFSKGGLLTLDPTIKPDWVKALKFDHTVLAREKAIPPLNFNAWITEKYVKAAYKDLGVDYDKQKAKIVDPKKYAGNADGNLACARGHQDLRDHGGIPQGRGQVQCRRREA